MRACLASCAASKMKSHLRNVSHLNPSPSSHPTNERTITLLPFCLATDSKTKRASNCISASCSSARDNAYCCQGSSVIPSLRFAHLTTRKPNEPVASALRGDSSAAGMVSSARSCAFILRPRQETLAALALSLLTASNEGCVGPGEG